MILSAQSCNTNTHNLSMSRLLRNKLKVTTIVTICLSDINRLFNLQIPAVLRIDWVNILAAFI